MPSADRPASSAAPHGRAAPAPRLWLVRHARPLVEAGLCYGRLDVAADPGHTRETAARLADALPPGAALRTSPRRRCRDLADALAALRPDLRPAAVDARLAEMDFGDWEGRRWDAIGPAALDAWTADFARHRPGGGESVADFMARVAEAFDAPAPGADRVWIAHAGVARAATLLARGLRRVERAADWPRTGPDFGAWTTLPPSGTGACGAPGAATAGSPDRP
ncbi:MAG: histidine phosphatase family protein [Xylophilus ampelinus]